MGEQGQPQHQVNLGIQSLPKNVTTCRKDGPMRLVFLPLTNSPEPSQDQQTSLCLHGERSDDLPSLSLYLGCVTICRYIETQYQDHANWPLIARSKELSLQCGVHLWFCYGFYISVDYLLHSLMHNGLMAFHLDISPHLSHLMLQV